MDKLTTEEQEILQSVERGEWRSVRNAGVAVAHYTEAAAATLRGDKRVNIRMAERDLVRFKEKALEEGLPYQTLISSVLNKLINGRLIENAF